jgi:hypothetical protein
MSSLSPAIDQLLSAVGKVARGSHQSQLDTQTLAALRRFGTFLVKEGKSENTARVYRSLCAKALAQGVDSDDPVMMSALRSLARFKASQ